MSLNPEDAPVVGTWKVTTADADARARLTELVMAWGKDAQTGEPRYVFELSSDRRGARCGCVCYSCGLPLTAVNAAKADWQVRPHFRHPDGAERNTCLVLTARSTALAMLQREDRVVLPARRVNTQVVGLSGKRYDAWLTRPAERVNIKSFKPRDEVSAVLTLEDGREVLVKLTGTLTAGSKGESLPVIELEVNDPALASLDPNDLKERLHLLVEAGSWCGMHWNDEPMTLDSRREAEAKAFEALDWLPPEAAVELEGASSQESLLHWLTKDILRQEGQLQVPAVVFREFYGGVPPAGSREVARRPASLLQLSSTRLEKKVGQIRPDVVTDYLDPLDGTNAQLLVEVTVTNEILPERLVRIQREGIAALEINIGRLGGQLTRQDFVRLVTEEVAAKRWLHHPWLVEKTTQRKAELEEAERVALLEVAKLRVLYLDAVKHLAGLRAQDLETPETRQAQKDAKERIRSIGVEFAFWGVENADDLELFGWQGCILDRLLSIQSNSAVGYRMTTLWQVLHTATREKAREKRGWHTLYLTALKAYAPTLEKRHQLAIDEWRDAVIKDLKDCHLQGRTSVYRRNRRFDALLGLLFPEMDQALKRPLPGDPSKGSNTATNAAKGPKDAGEGAGFSARRNRDLWLKGAELEDWKTRHPLEAEAWERGRRGR